MAFGKHLLVLAVVVLLASMSEAKGTLRVDNIVAIEAPIVVDALLGDVAEITGETGADTLGFGSFDTMRLTAPFLDFSASFLDVSATESIDFEAQDGDLNLSARHSVDVNGDRIDFQAGEDIGFNSAFGELSIVAGEEIRGQATSMSVTADAGGIAILSEGHDVTIEADNSLFVLSDEATGVINVETSDDLHATGTTQVFVVADGDIDLNSRGKLIFDGTENLSVIASEGNVLFVAGDEVDVDVGGNLSISSLATEITSTTDGIELHGFVSTEIDSSNGRLTLNGNSKGVTFTAPSAPVSFTSTDDALTFTAAGSGEQPGIYVRGEVEAEIVDAFVIDADHEAQILGNSISIESDTAILEANNLFSSSTDNDQVLSADTGSFVVQADEIVLAATDFNDQSSLLSITADTVTYNGDTMRSFGQEFDIEAGNGDWTLDADAITIDAHGGDVVEQQIDIEIGDTATLTGGDMNLIGGHMFFSSEGSSNYDVSGDLEISTRQDGGSSTILSGENVSVTSNGGDFTVDDTFGSLSIHAEDNDEGDSSIVFTGGDIELNAGLGPFQTGVEFDMTAHNQFSIASTGGNTASDVEFDARDLYFTSSTSAEFLAVGDLDVDSSSDFYLEADSAIVAGNQNDGDAVIFDSDGFMYLITSRDPSTDDSITFDGPGNLIFSFDDVTLGSTGPAVLEGGEDIMIVGDAVTISSNNFNPITFDMEGALTADIGDDLEMSGTHLTLDAFTDLTIDVESDFGLLSTERGYSVAATEGDLSFLAINDIAVSSETGDIISTNFLPNSPGGPIDFTIDNDIDIIGSDSVNIQSRDGDVNFTAGGSILVDLGDDGTLTTGDSLTDTFTIDASGTLLFQSSLDTSVTGAGPLTFTSGDDTTITGSTVSFSSANGDVNISGTTGVEVNAAGSTDLTGGAIEIEATETDVTVDGGAIAIESREAFVATEEVFGLADDIVFTAGGDILFDAPNGQMEFNSDDFGLTSESSSVDLSGASFLLDSNLLRQDIAFVAEGAVNITAANDITQFAAGDFSIVAANYTEIAAEDVLFNVEADLTMAAVQGSVLLNNTDGNVAFIVRENPNDASPVEEVTNMEFRATQEISGIATAGAIAFTSNGDAQLRLNEDGGRATAGATFNNAKFADTNGGLGSGPQGTLPNLASQPVGFSIATRHAEGNIVLQSVFSDVFVNSDETQEWITNGAMSVTAGDSISHQTGPTDLATLTADDGALQGYALQGTFTLDVADDLDIFATGSMEILSAEQVTFDVDAEVMFNIHTSDLIFETFLQHNILISGRDLEFTGGAKGVHLIPQGDISATSEGDTLVSGNRGVFMSTNTGPLNITSASLGNTVTAEEDISIFSGGDLLLANTGNSNEDVRFNGVGVVFSTTQGPLQMTSQGIANADAEAITIQSVGTSTTSRDRVLFDTNGSLLSFTAASAHVDANELFSVGLTTSPDVTFTAAGSAAVDAIDINSAGNIDITSEGIINFTPTGSFQSQSQSDAHFSGFNGVTLQSTAANVAFQSVGGTLNFLADQSVLIDAQDIRLTSEGLMQLVQNSNANPIEFIITSGMEVISEGVLSNLVDNDVTYTTVGGDISIFSDTNSGGHRLTFTASEAVIMNAANDVNFSSSDILDVVANDGDMTFTSQMYDISTSGELSDVVFTSTGGDLLVSTETLTSTSDRALFSAVSSDSPGTISLVIDDTTLSALGSAFGTSNSVEGSIIVDAVDDIELVASTALFTVTESTTFSAFDSVEFNTEVTTFNAGRIFMETQVNEEGVIEFESASTLDLILPSSARFDAAVAVEVTSDVATFTSLGQMLFLSKGNARENSDITIDSVAGFIFDPPADFLVTAGSDRYAGDIEWSVDGSFQWTGDDVIFEQTPPLNPYQGGLDSIEIHTEAANIELNAVNSFNVFAGSSYATYLRNTEEGLGYIELVADNLAADATGDLIFAVENAGFSLETSSLNMEAAGQLNIRTQGIDSGIFFESSGILSLNPTLSLVNAELAANNRFTVEAETFQSLATQLNVGVTGPGGKDDVGIELVGYNSASFSSLTESITTGGARYHADGSISISNDALQVTGGSVLLNTEGFSLDGQPELRVTANAAAFVMSSATDVTALVDGLTVVDGGSGTLTAAAGEIVHSSSGDVTVQSNNLAGSFTAAGEMRFIAEDSGILMSASVADRTLLATDVIIQSGLVETSNSVNFVAELGSAPSPSVLVVAGTTLRNDVSNNFLAEAAVTHTINAATNIDFLARKGSQLFNSVTLDAFLPGEQLTPRETLVQANTGGIFMEAHYFIRHRQHQFLDFFVGRTQVSHTRPSAPQQRTSFDMISINNRQACVCISGSVSCNNVACPETYNRVRQMQRALLDMGLLRF